MVNRALFSSNSDEWETPLDLFIQLDLEFHFNLDLAASPDNTKCVHYYTKQHSGLDCMVNGRRWNVWCNPPYSQIAKRVEKCAELSHHVGVVVMLIPSRTDTRWFHEFIYNKPNVEIRFIKGRLRFSGSKNSAPFPSMIVIFRNQNGDNNITSEN